MNSITRLGLITLKLRKKNNSMFLKKRIISFSLFAAILWTGTYVFAQVEKQAMEKSLSIENIEHPYLLFDEKGKQELLDEIDKNPVLKEIYERQILEAFRGLRMPVDADIPGGGDLSRYFSNNEMRHFKSMHYSTALNLAFVCQLTGKEEYAKKLICMRRCYAGLNPGSTTFTSFHRSSMGIFPEMYYI